MAGVVRAAFPLPLAGSLAKGKQRAGPARGVVKGIERCRLRGDVACFGNIVQVEEDVICSAHPAVAFVHIASGVDGVVALFLPTAGKRNRRIGLYEQPVIQHLSRPLSQ